MNQQRKLIPLAGIILSFLAQRAQAQEQASPFEGLFPEAKRMAAPAWLKEGVRLSYHSSSAMSPKGRFSFTEDPKGKWINPWDPHGKKYRREELWGKGGAGYTQIDVVGIEGNRAAMNIASYGLMNGRGPLVFLGTASHLGYTGLGGDFWIHPAVLRSLRIGETAGGTLRITRGRWPVNGRTREAVGFSYMSGIDRYGYVFDLETGILLNSHAIVVSGPSYVHTRNQFLGKREVRVPSTLPTWAERAAPMSYQGRLTVHAGSGPAMVLGLSVDLRFGQRRRRWVRYRQTRAQSGVYGMPSQRQETDRIWGAAQLIGAPGIAPEVLKGWKAGETLDRDDITGVTIRVARADGGLVVLEESASGYGARYVYDSGSGKLLEMELLNRVLNVRQQVRLTRG